MAIEAPWLYFRHSVQDGEENTIVDAVFKLPAELTLATISVPFALDFGELEE